MGNYKLIFKNKMLTKRNITVLLVVMGGGNTLSTEYYCAS